MTANESAVGKFWGPLWSEGDETVADEIFDPLFRDIDPQWPNGADGGIDAMKEKLAFYRAVCDWRFTVLEQIATGNKVVCHWRGTGAHRGEFAGAAPTGKTLSMDGIGIFTCRDGKIVEQVLSYDLLGLLRQLGIQQIPG